jgi:hypothetical protein
MSSQTLKQTECLDFPSIQFQTHLNWKNLDKIFQLLVEIEKPLNLGSFHPAMALFCNLPSSLKLRRDKLRQSHRGG